MAEITVTVVYYVRASRSAQEAGERFGPVNTESEAVALLNVLAARADIIKATIEQEQV